METDIVESLRMSAEESDAILCGYSDELLKAAAEIERLRAVCGSMDDPSRCSKFELSEDGTMIRTVTYTHWRSVDT